MNAVVDRLGWTLIHSLWEGALAWMLLKLVLAALPRGSAQARYVAGCAALVGAVLAPWVTFWRLGSWSTQSSAFSMGSGASFQTQLNLPVQVVPVAFAAPEPLSNLAHVVAAVLPWVVLAWALGCAVGLLRLTFDWRATRRLASAPCHPLPEALAKRCLALAARLGVRRMVQMGESLLVDVPSVVGWLKPRILVPVGAFAGLSADQIDALLAHELAHILRNDFLVNLMQCIADAVFFYHPAIQAINRIVRDERENACDDIAVALGGDPVRYAAALTCLEERRRPALTLAATGNGSLFVRVRRLLGHTPPVARSAPRITGMAMAGAVLFLFTALGAPALVADLSPGQASPGPAGEAHLPLLMSEAKPRPTVRTGGQTEIVVVNLLREPVRIYWMDRQGFPRYYGDAKPGEQHVQWTYAGHVWVITRHDGAILGVFEARAPAGEADIAPGAEVAPHAKLILDNVPYGGSVDLPQLKVESTPRPSVNAGNATVIVFLNRLKTPVNIFWIDPRGERRPYGQAKPGERHVQLTYAGHVWLVTAPDGTTLGVYQANDVSSEATIESPAGRQ